MPERQKTLSQRREELVARSTIQREQLAAALSDAWHPKALSTGKNIASQARRHPWISAGLGTLGVLFFRRSRLFSLVASAAVALQVWHQVSPYVMPVVIRFRRYLDKRAGRA